MALEKAATVSPVSSGTGFTKGAWVEVISSVVTQSQWVMIQLSTAAALQSFRHMRFDLGIGLAASEVAKIEDFALFAASAGTTAFTSQFLGYSFSFQVSVGDRIAVRVADDAASADTWKIQVTFLNAVL